MRKMNTQDASGVQDAPGAKEHGSAATNPVLLPFLTEKYIAEGGNTAGRG